jgi:hypothetical protein
MEKRYPNKALKVGLSYLDSPPKGKKGGELRDHA